jgi:hypothetical protein
VNDESQAEAAARRAARLLRWYPRDWRSRYGDEFAELLIADISERPDSWRRHADVAISGVLARLIPTGLTGHAIDPADQSGPAWPRSGTCSACSSPWA